MNMTTALRYSEDYSDPNAEVWQYSAAGSPLPKPEGYTGPVGYSEYLQTVKKAGEHSDAFGYKTINADALGWIIARASGKSVADLLADRVWSKLEMEQSAYYQVDAKGTPFAGGGLSAGLRDMARVLMSSSATKATGGVNRFCPKRRCRMFKRAAVKRRSLKPGTPGSRAGLTGICGG